MSSPKVRRAHSNNTDQDCGDSKESYRELLCAADQSSLNSYEKTLITLSGGALGVSIAFINNVIRPPQQIQTSWSLLCAWICWGSSLGCVLVSFYCSHRALRKAIHQFDEGKLKGDVPRGFWECLAKMSQMPGGIWACIVNVLNFLSGVVFIIGMVFMVIFAYHNVR